MSAVREYALLDLGIKKAMAIYIPWCRKRRWQCWPAPTHRRGAFGDLRGLLAGSRASDALSTPARGAVITADEGVRADAVSAEKECR